MVIVIKFNIVKIDKSNLTELSLLMAWRSNPEIYKFFLVQQGPLSWDNHYKFITESINRLDFLVYFQNRPVGHVALSNIDHNYPEVSIMLGETTLWGKGYSTMIMKSFLQLLKSIGYYRFSAIISNLNTSSIRLFVKLGFVRTKTSEVNSLWGVYHLDT